MKLSLKIILPILLIFTLLISLAGCFITPSDEQPGYTPGTITGIIAAPCCSTSTADPVPEAQGVSPEYWCYYCEKNWNLQDSIKVILTYGEEEKATVFTNEDGEYTFTNVEPGKNYVITALCPDYDDERPLVKDVALEVVEGEAYDAKITDCISTSLGLVVDFLVTYTVLEPEDIDLEPVAANIPNFWSFPRFKKLVIEVCRALAECGNLSTDEDVQDALCEAAEEVGRIVIPDLELGCGPEYTPPEPPPGACVGNLSPIIDSVWIDGVPVAINAVIDVVLGDSYEITVNAHDQDGKLGTLTYYASANGVESAATTSNKVTITPILPDTFEVYVFVHDGCVETQWGPVNIVVDCCPLAEPGVTIDIIKSLNIQRRASLPLCLDECATINSVTVKYTGADPLPDLIITNLNDSSLAWSYDNTNISFNKTSGEVCLVGGLSGAAGTYNIGVIYTDPCGKTAEGSTSLTFSDCSCIDPTANAGPDQSEVVCSGTDALIDLVGSGSGTGTLYFAWDLDNDSQFDDSTEQDPQNIPFGIGVHTVRLQVTDDCGSTTDEMIVTITLSGCINHAPVIANIPSPQYVINGHTFTYDVNATDPDGDTLTYTLTVNPLGMNIDSITGIITWSQAYCPDRCWTCPVNVTVKVTDDGCCGTKYSTKSFTVIVREY